jgi:hypothetical protein
MNRDEQFVNVVMLALIHYEKKGKDALIILPKDKHDVKLFKILTTHLIKLHNKLEADTDDENCCEFLRFIQYAHNKMDGKFIDTLIYNAFRGVDFDELVDTDASEFVNEGKYMEFMNTIKYMHDTVKSANVH